MGQVIKIEKPLEKLVLEIRAHVHDAGRAETTCAKHQLQAGLRLIELRARVEQDGGNWWAFFDDKFTGYIKSRSYAEKLMRWARADDPDGAIDAENSKARERMRRLRAVDSAERSAEQSNQSLSNRVEYDIVAHALRLVERMSEEERERFDQLYREKYQ